jgi:hypothetical protein
MTALLPRLALAGFVLALAAAVMGTMGSGGLGGSLGSLFGYKERLAAPSQPVVLNPVALVDVKQAVTPPAHALTRPPRAITPQRVRSRVAPKQRPARPVPVVGAPGPAPAPSPSPVPVPSAPSPPPPAPPGNVQRVEQAVRQVTAPVAPAAQPVEQVLHAVDTICGVAAGCP